MIVHKLHTKCNNFGSCLLKSMQQRTCISSLGISLKQKCRKLCIWQVSTVSEVPCSYVTQDPTRSCPPPVTNVTHLQPTLVSLCNPPGKRSTHAWKCSMFSKRNKWQYSILVVPLVLLVRFIFSFTASATLMQNKKESDLWEPDSSFCDFLLE